MYAIRSYYGLETEQLPDRRCGRNQRRPRPGGRRVTDRTGPREHQVPPGRRAEGGLAMGVPVGERVPGRHPTCAGTDLAARPPGRDRIQVEPVDDSVA